jgi:hypothetical protein
VVRSPRSLSRVLPHSIARCIIGATQRQSIPKEEEEAVEKDDDLHTARTPVLCSTLRHWGGQQQCGLDRRLSDGNAVLQRFRRLLEGRFLHRLCYHLRGRFLSYRGNE